jgi:hypothetical protein
MAQTYYAQDLITDAARTIGAIASGESLTTDELNDGLISLNKIVDGWSALGLLIMQIAEQVIPLNGQNQPYTLAYRPSKIRAASCSSGVVSMPVEILAAEQWSQIVDNSLSGAYASKMFCDYALASNIFWWPTATGDLHLFFFQALTQWPDLDTTQVTLAPGYARGLTLNLAVDLCEQYGKPVTQSLMMTAQSSRQDIMNANNRIFGQDMLPDQPMPMPPKPQVQPGG